MCVVTFICVYMRCANISVMSLLRRHYHQLQHTATHCNTLHHTATLCNLHKYKFGTSFIYTCSFIVETWLTHMGVENFICVYIRCANIRSDVSAASTLLFAATHYNALQHTATHCTTPQYTATHCSTLQHTATHCITLHHTAAHCNTLQHTATHCNTRQHTAICTNTNSNPLLSTLIFPYSRYDSFICVLCLPSVYTSGAQISDLMFLLRPTLSFAATHCNTLQHTATHCNLHQVRE